ncbi:hypothetical protein OOT00_11290 [Desulfobotulus sp. H1]|uniref:Outer membrane protein beta-barrel domain-containing protein n=1 Tax=Desulfobotulus pelophilus TaxID=2823377 RepID=A0ABT3NAT7_9BACT|nr:hypothetical protein [Desulfobotulus pelophilus]MCW7754567.1 hypothetical protein [Desulfobotulus pelophilus]
MKRFGLGCALLILLAAIPAYAGFGASLYVNQSSVAGSLMADMDTGTGYGAMALGAEGVYKDDDFTMLSGIFAVKNDNFMPGIRYLVGFKGFYLDAEKSGGHLDNSATGLAFLFGMGYELDAGLNPLPIPVSVDGQLAASPKPLTWQEGEYYWEARAGLGFHVLSNATIRLDFRRLSAKFEDKGHSWSKDDYNVLLGYEIRF